MPVVCAVVLSSCSGPSGSLPNPPITGFGGYHEWLQGAARSVTQVSAQWYVPQINDVDTVAHDDAHASTWVGVENRQGDFLQIGISEDEFAGGPGSSYFEFWSAPNVGFHPQFLQQVYPGDQIEARMVQTNRGWYLAIHDLATGVTDSHFSSIYPKRVVMQDALWIQEDPGDSSSDHVSDLPYPSMTQVTFTDLQVNNSPPALSYNDAQALASPNGVVLVPELPQQDSFSLQSGTRQQWAYLTDIGAYDQSFSLFDDSRLSGGGATAANGQALIKALSVLDSRLARRQWPATAALDIESLVANIQILSRDLSAWEERGEPKTLLTEFRQAAHSGQTASNRVRADLGLPPVGLDGAPR